MARDSRQKATGRGKGATTGRPRPPKRVTEQMVFLATPAVADRVRASADAQGVSVAERLRRLVAAALAAEDGGPAPGTGVPPAVFKPPSD